MTQQEFETRVQMKVSNYEFGCINEVYMNSDLEKDDFCSMWILMNRSRVNAAKEKAMKEAREQRLREDLYDIINRNHDKSYNLFASDYFTKKQKMLLVKVGITMDEERVEPIFGHTVRDPKLVSTVLYEIKKYLKVA